jgi:hypothetical protein
VELNSGVALRDWLPPNAAGARIARAAGELKRAHCGFFNLVPASPTNSTPAFSNALRILALFKTEVCRLPFSKSETVVALAPALPARIEMDQPSNRRAFLAWLDEMLTSPFSVSLSARRRS